MMNDDLLKDARVVEAHEWYCSTSGPGMSATDHIQKMSDMECRPLLGAEPDEHGGTPMSFYCRVCDQPIHRRTLDPNKLPERDPPRLVNELPAPDKGFG